LVNVFISQRKDIRGLSTLLEDEIARTDDARIIFRQNSLSTKVFDTYLKTLGGGWLIDTLGDIVKTIVRCKDSCEVDITRGGGSGSNDTLVEADVKRNFKRLVGFVDAILECICGAVDSLPRYFPLFVTPSIVDSEQY
jgi:hypothetical protein